MQKLITGPWKSNGIEHKVETERNSGESDDDFVARHKRAVDAMLRAFPKDP